MINDPFVAAMKLSPFQIVLWFPDEFGEIEMKLAINVHIHSSLTMKDVFSHADPVYSKA
jgi:hypothetical protein